MWRDDVECLFDDEGQGRVILLRGDYKLVGDEVWRLFRGRDVEEGMRKRLGGHRQQAVPPLLFVSLFALPNLSAWLAPKILMIRRVEFLANVKYAVVVASGLVPVRAFPQDPWFHGHAS